MRRYDDKTHVGQSTEQPPSSDCLQSPARAQTIPSLSLIDHLYSVLIIAAKIVKGGCAKDIQPSRPLESGIRRMGRGAHNGKDDNDGGHDCDLPSVQSQSVPCECDAVDEISV